MSTIFYSNIYVVLPLVGLHTQPLALASLLGRRLGLLGMLVLVLVLALVNGRRNRFRLMIGDSMVP